MRQLSATAIDSIYSQETAEVWLYLVTIEHESMTTTRAVNNVTSIDSRGNTYQAMPFDLTIPAELEGEIPQVTLIIDNIGRDLMEAVRSLSGQPTITLEVVLASDPDTVEIGPYVFSATSIDYSAFQIRIQVSYESLLTEPFNWRKFTPQDFPALFTVVR